MSLHRNIADEVRRSPIAALSGAAAVVIAALSLVLAWLQFQATTVGVPLAAAFPSISPPSSLYLGNVLLLIAYFLAVTVAASVILRAIARKHDIAALFFSIPLVALTNFSTVLVVYLAPPRPLSAQLFNSAHDLVFYASAAVVIAFCGRAVLRDMGSTITWEKPDGQPKETSSGNPAFGLLVMAMFLLAIWSWLVFAGQTRLARTLLPEITHPTDVKPTKSGA